MKGILRSVEYNLLDNVWKVSIETHATPPDDWKPHETELDFEKHSKRRTLTANAYYWVLLGKLARKFEVSNAFLHNFLLRRDGVFAETDMVVQIPDTDEAAKKTDESEAYHLKPTSKTMGDFRLYLILKGSHEMTMPEFAKLLNGLIEDCKDNGIETMTPDELSKLKYLETFNGHTLSMKYGGPYLN